MERTDDLDLIRRFRNGDEGAFNQLVRKYQEMVYRLCHRMVRDVDDAQDLTQEAFMKAYLSLPRFRERSGFYTWIYRIATNLCINFSKKRSARKKAVLGSIFGDPAIELDRRTAGVAINAAISSLPPRQRAVFVMRHYEGMSYEDIARVTKRSVGAMKASYHHAVLKLRDLLKEYGP